jgi:hypothetical protein
MFIFFTGCSSSNINTQHSKQISQIDKENEFDELDRIDAEMQYELSPSSNAIRKFQACPIP